MSADNHTSETPLKRCSKCGVEYPATTEHFTRNSSTADGLYSLCKGCKNSLATSRRVVTGRRVTNAETARLEELGLLRCGVCDELFPATTEYFYLLKSARYNRKFSDSCKDCGRLRTRTYNKNNPAKARIRSRQRRTEDPERYHQRLKENYWKNPEQKRQRTQAWRENNRERHREYGRNWRKQNPDKLAAQQSHYSELARKWSKAHPEKIKAYALSRRALEQGLPSTPIDERRALNYFNGCCAVCGRPPGLWHTLAMDHWIAITDKRLDNPGSVPTNVIPLCHSKKGANGQGSCNHSKGSKDPDKWLIDKFGKRKASAILKRINAYFEWVAIS